MEMRAPPLPWVMELLTILGVCRITGVEGNTGFTLTPSTSLGTSFVRSITDTFESSVLFGLRPMRLRCDMVTLLWLGVTLLMTGVMVLPWKARALPPTLMMGGLGAGSIFLVGGAREGGLATHWLGGEATIPTPGEGGGLIRITELVDGGLGRVETSVDVDV